MACRALERLACGGCASADDGADRRAREQEDPGEDCEDAHERGSGAAERERDDVAEDAAEVAALVSERQQQADPEDGEAGAKRPDVDEIAARDHQPSDYDEDDGQYVRRAPDQRLQRLTDPTAYVAAVPAGPEDGRQEKAEREQPEPDQLRVLMPASGLSLRALRFPHARGRTRLEHALGGASPRHGQRFDALRRSPPRSTGATPSVRRRPWLLL